MPELKFNGVDGSSVYLKQWHLPNDGGTHVWQIDSGQRGTVIFLPDDGSRLIRLA